jgi:precorrin-3B synthase
MQAEDGLLVRLRVTAGRLPAATLRAIARAGRDHGNGRFDQTSRSNLQMRGIEPAALARVHDILEPLGLLDRTIAGEAIRNVLASPLAGLEGFDIGPIAAELEAALVAEPGLHALPAKFRFAIDDGSALSLAGVPADIRFERAGASTFDIALGGRTGETAIIGSCAPDAITAHALRLARAFLELAGCLPEPARRMSNLLRAVGPKPIAAVAGLPARPVRIRPRAPAMEPCPVGPVHIGDRGLCFGAGAAFGRLDAAMLEAAAEAAERYGDGEIRLTPWRALILPGISAADMNALADFLSDRGFAVDPADERLAIAACGGRSACASATTDTHADALALAAFARRLVPLGIGIHVSGCAKGCARSVPAPCVLVAREERYDVVVAGTARGTPSARGLTFVEARELVEHITRTRHVVS